MPAFFIYSERYGIGSQTSCIEHSLSNKNNLVFMNSTLRQSLGRLSQQCYYLIIYYTLRPALGNPKCLLYVINGKIFREKQTFFL